MPKLTLGKFEKALKLSENRALNTAVKNIIIISFPSTHIICELFGLEDFA